MNFAIDQIDDDAIVALDGNEVEAVSGGFLCGLFALKVVATAALAVCAVSSYKPSCGTSSHNGGHKGSHNSCNNGGGTTTTT